MNYSIQILRGLAALLVVIYHASIKYDQSYGGYIFHFGNIGVDIFFIISGYVMSLIYSKRKLDVRSFVVDRLRRILPIYWLLTLAGYIAYLLYPSLVNSSGGNTYVFESFFLWPVDGKFLIQNGWTLSFEFYFYLLFGAASLMLGHYVYSVVLLFTLPILASFFNVDWANNFLANTIVYEFVYGIIAFYILEYVKNTYWKLTLFLLAILVIFYCIGGRSGSDGLIAFILVVTLGHINISKLEIERFIVLRLLSRLGDSSYSLYLVHVFSLVFLSKLYQCVVEVDSYVLFVFVLCFGSVICGWFFNCLIEKPIDQYLKKILINFS